MTIALIDALVDYLERFSNDGLDPFLNEWKEKDILFNQVVTLTSGEKKYKGICTGINEQGHLLLQHADNVIHAYSSGDTSLT